MIGNPCRDNPCPSFREKWSIDLYSRGRLCSSLFFFPPASIPCGKFAINDDCLREHRLQAAVRSDERSLYRDHRVKPRPSSVAKSSDAVSDDELFAIKRDATTWQSDRTTTTELLRGRARRGSPREPRSGQIGRKRIVRRRVEADVSIVLLVEESAGERIRLVINHPSDAERIDVAERADGAVGLPSLLVILPP